MEEARNSGRRAEDVKREAEEEINRALQGKVFASREEANVIVAPIIERQNRRPQEYFQGLSSWQMSRMMSAPFDSPEVVTFTEAPEGAMDAPIMHLFAILVEAIGEQGVKTTSTGNLPRNLVRASALAYWGEERYRKYTASGELQKEQDFGDLHVTRLVAELAGLIRKYKGKFILSRSFHALEKKAGLAGAYLPLLRAFAQKFNWAYMTMGDELMMIQRTFLFTVYLLQRFGEQWRETTYYADAFLTAFPTAINEAIERQYISRDNMVRCNYSSRALRGFAQFLGLAEMRPIGEPKELRAEIRKLPLLDALVRFS